MRHLLLSLLGRVAQARYRSPKSSDSHSKRERKAAKGAWQSVCSTMNSVLSPPLSLDRKEGEDLTRRLSFLSDSYLTAIPAPSFLCRPDLLVGDQIPLRGSLSRVSRGGVRKNPSRGGGWTDEKAGAYVHIAFCLTTRRVQERDRPERMTEAFILFLFFSFVNQLFNGREIEIDSKESWNAVS